MIVEDSGEIFTGRAGGPFSSATFPIPCVTRSGRWLCAFRGAPAKGATAGQHVLLTWSDDCGKTWKEPFAPFAPPAIDGRPGLFRFAGLTRLHGGRVLAALNWVDNSDPDAPYFNESTEGLLDTRVLLSESRDDGVTWSKPVLVDTAPFNVPTPLTGPVVRFDNDELCCQIELNKHYTDPAPWQHKSVLLFSTDGGATWPRHCIVTEDPENRIFYWDQRVSLLPDGRLFVAFWTYDRIESRYLNIHTCFSDDRGVSWTALRDSGVAGQPGPIFTLEDGELVMPVVDRSGAPRITVRRSEDNGVTWPDEDVVVVYDSGGASQTREKASMQDAWAEMTAFSVGLPSVAALPGGGGVLVYYAGSETNATGIRWAKIE
jgi:hypothetical protein